MGRTQQRVEQYRPDLRIDDIVAENWVVTANQLERDEFGDWVGEIRLTSYNEDYDWFIWVNGYNYGRDIRVRLWREPEHDSPDSETLREEIVRTKEEAITIINEMVAEADPH